jgi:hypothetical protein
VRHIISASRRTDIPAFYSEWFVRRLKARVVYVRNPYGSQIRKVSLSPEDIHSIVFWSKNYSLLLSRLDEIEGTAKNLFFHHTITGMPHDIEQNTAPIEDTVKDYRYLAGKYSTAHLVWRFDPVCITDKLPFSFYEERFTQIAERLEGSCVQCYISFVQKYKKALVNFDRYSDHVLVDVEEDFRRDYALRLSRIAEKHGIRLYACCNDYLISESVRKGSCINGSELSQLFHDYSLPSPPSPTRKECACSRSIDIGAYDTCPHGCLYCYANSDRKRSRNAFGRMDMSWNGLGFNVDEEIKVHEGQDLRR